MNRKRYFVLAFLILALTSFLRFYKLGAIPYSLYWDEVAMLLDAKTVAATGRDMHNRPWFQIMYPSYGDYKQPVYIWLASASVKFFGVSNFALRFPSAVIGIASVLLAMLLALEIAKLIKLKDSQAWLLSLYTGFVLAISPWSILFSRTGFEGHLGQFFLGLAVYLLFLAKRKNQLLFQLLSVLAAALATYSYFSVRFVWPIVFLGFMLFFIQIRAKHGSFSLTRRAQSVFAFFVLPLALYYVLLLPMFRSPLYADSNQYRLSADSIFNLREYALEQNVLREQAGNSLLDRLYFHRHHLLLRELAKNYSDHLSFGYIFLNGDENLRHSTGEHGLFLWPFVLPFIYSFYYLYKRDKRLLGFLFVWWMLALLPASVPEATPHSLRSLNALFPLTLLIGLGMNALFSDVFHGIAMACWLLVLLSLAQFTYHYFYVYPDDSAFDWQNGYQELVYEIENRIDSVERVFIQPSHDRWYLWWFAYGKITPEEIQAKETKGFRPKDFGKIQFGDSNWPLIRDKYGKFIIVEEPSVIGESLRHFPDTFFTIDKEEIHSSSDRIMFDLVTVSRPHE